MSPSAHARRSSFYWAMRAMPRARREAMFAIYGIARAVDDVADGEGTQDDKRLRLDHWAREIDAAYDAEPSEPEARALAPWLKRFRLPRGEFDHLLAGMRMDIDGPIVAPPLADLRLYCRRVAGSIGLLSLPVFGCESDADHAFAEALGEALQLTNILRDAGEDATRGRLYLPREFLTAHAVPIADASQAVAHLGFAAAWRDCADLARDDFARAERLLRQCDRRRLAPATMMMGIYRAMFEAMLAQGWPQAVRPSVGVWRRLAIMARVTLLGRP